MGVGSSLYIDEEALFLDLDALAGIASIERFHDAALETLRSLAHELTGQPSTRTGRYAAVRDVLTQAIERIEDESFADAAEALLGYQDRWRSVRDRGTDAGRAFTPAVSYDAFRRRSGRNYRTNTLRMVVAAIVAMVGEHRTTAVIEVPVAAAGVAAAPVIDLRESAGPATTPGGAPAAEVDVRGPAPDTTATASAEPDRPVDPASLASSPRAPRRRTWLVVGLAVLGCLGVVWAVLLAGSGAEAASVTRGEIDVSRHCRLAWSADGKFFGQRTSDTDLGWECTNADGTARRSPVMDDACREQYGPSAAASFTDGWQCELKLDDLRSPSANTTGSECLIAVGSYDKNAREEFDRFPSRIAEAVAAADLPTDVCADAPLHRYGDPAAGGVTQLLHRDGAPYGAVLANDPGTVVILSGDPWREYRSVRGLALYGLGVDYLEERPGYPTTDVSVTDGVWRIDLDDGGALVSDRADAGFVWIPAEAVRVWKRYGEAGGCLGLPEQTPFAASDGVKFEHAVVSIDPSTGNHSIKPDVCA